MPGAAIAQADLGLVVGAGGVELADGDETVRVERHILFDEKGQTTLSGGSARSASSDRSPPATRSPVFRVIATA